MALYRTILEFKSWQSEMQLGPPSLPSQAFLLFPVTLPFKGFFRWLVSVVVKIKTLTFKEDKVAFWWDVNVCVRVSGVEDVAIGEGMVVWNNNKWHLRVQTILLQEINEVYCQGILLWLRTAEMITDIWIQVVMPTAPNAWRFGLWWLEVHANVTRCPLSTWESRVTHQAFCQSLETVRGPHALPSTTRTTGGVFSLAF